MDLVTVVCQRDINEILLQAQSIDLFVEKPTTHWIIVEDNSLSLYEWEKLLSPYYTRHTLNVSFSIRDELRNDEFHEPWKYGWRRQQTLSFMASRMVKSDRYLSLDSKNFFVRTIDLDALPLRHGSGRYADTKEILTTPKLHILRNWLLYISQETGMKIPDKVCGGPCETPFVMNTQISRKITQEIEFEKLFFQPELYHVPRSEYHLYWFYVPENEYDHQKEYMSGALHEQELDKTIPIDDYISQQIQRSIDIQSYTHGIHRSVRKLMDASAKDSYKKWLTQLGFDDILIEQYIE
jgi:hypothetical protein